MHQPVLISGGGIVGAFLGLELASRNIPFQIIEKTQWFWFMPFPDFYLIQFEHNFTNSEKTYLIGFKNFSRSESLFAKF